jgi:hypothetical protein
MADDEPAKKKVFTPDAIHLVRTVEQIHVQLSAMADHKASILMGATFVVFTITIGQSRGTIPPLPLLVLGGFSFFAAICAVLAILPAVHTKPHSTINLLFFGSFTQLPEEEYLDRLIDRLQDSEAIYRTMARDIYQNGQVLERKKYRLLGYAYRIFLAGLTASFLTFVVQYALHKPV